MELIIFFIDSRQVELRIIERGEIKFCHLLAVDMMFDTLLVTGLDKFLAENRIDTLSLDTVSVAGELDDNSTACKIAQAVAAALNVRISALSTSISAQ